MRQLVVGAVIAVIFLACGLGVQSAAAVSQSVVISGLQLGTSAAATHEFVQLYNNSEEDTDITNWCVYYASATSLTNGSRLGCFAVEASALHLFLPAKSQAFLISTQMHTASPTLGSDLLFSATLSGSAGHVRVIDSDGIEIDKIGWGMAALSPEASAAPTVPNGQVLTRKLIVDSVDVFQDTDDNASDFELTIVASDNQYGSIYEVQDMCTNIEGLQQAVPDMYVDDGTGTCLPPPVDVCPNIDGMQIDLPLGHEFDLNNDCIDVDMCHNLPDTQLAVPEYYVDDSAGYCTVALPLIIINEVMPNPDGDDDGNEFIELYNPNDADIVMDLYSILVGNAPPKSYYFPSGTIIPAHSYLSLSDDDINFTLVNSTSVVQLVDTDGLIISSVQYVEPPAGSSWSMIESVWQYTNVPTTGAVNQKSTVDTDVEEELVGIKPCAANQYRHPDTNRCRLIVTAGSSLTPCKENQYRSEETNRCRNIATSTGALAPCGVNQERNLDTNRCRNVVTSIPEVPFAVEPIVQTGEAAIGWWALGGVGIIALAYAGWEWRSEIAKASRRMAGFFVRAK